MDKYLASKSRSTTANNIYFVFSNPFESKRVKPEIEKLKTMTVSEQTFCQRAKLQKRIIHSLKLDKCR